MPLLKDRTGHVYGRLTVTGRYDCGPASKGQRTKWICYCECGGSKIATGHELASGDTTSCGCLRAERTGKLNRTHGMVRTPTYRSWQAAKDRCYNPQNERYPAYGARGIRVCERWLNSFDAFLADMGERPSGMTLDRRDTNGHYEPNNCRWATNSEQMRTKRTSILWNGELITIAGLARSVGVPRTSLNKLIKRGLTIEAAVDHAIAASRVTYPPSN